MGATWLFVHGGSHGAWCWDGVRERLELRGLATASLDLPGSGADVQSRVGLGLRDSVTAIVDAIDRIPPGPVTLVGHSIGGMPLPPAAAARPDRVDALVFIAAVVLRQGERGIDVIPEDRRPSYFAMAEASGENSVLPGFAEAHRRFFPSLGEEEARAVYARLTPQPLGPYLEPAEVGIEAIDIPRTYVLVEGDVTFPAPVAMGFAEKAGVEPVRMPGDHCVMLTDPEGLASVLEEVAVRNHR